MAKRFTETKKWRSPFYRGLQGAYKLLWDYLCCDCDHAGIWIVDFEIAQTCIGRDMPVTASDALKFFNEDEERIIVFDNGKKWFIPGFIEFQYVQLSEKNRAHIGVIKTLAKYNLIDENFNIKFLNKGLTSPLQGVKEKEQEKEQEKEERGTGKTNAPRIEKGASVLIVPEMLAQWKEANPGYVVTNDDIPAVRQIADMIAKAKGMPSYTDFKSVEEIKSTWQVFIDFLPTDNLYKDFQLTQVAKYFNAIAKKIVSSMEQKKSAKPSILETNAQALSDARNIVNKMFNQTPSNENGSS